MRQGTAVREAKAYGAGVVVGTGKGSFQAPSVVFTPSLGGLKAGNISFDPELPDDKLRNANIPTRLAHYRQKVAMQTNHLNCPICMLFGKQNDEWHMRSTPHMERVLEAAQVMAVAKQSGPGDPAPPLGAGMGKGTAPGPGAPRARGGWVCRAGGGRI